LLEPFNLVTPIPARGTPPAYPLYVATVTPSTLGTTNTVGWYDQQVFTWLRGTNSILDNASTWALVGEAAKIISVTDPATAIPSSGVVQVAHFSDTPFSNYWENVGVVYSLNGMALTEVSFSPAQGQYQIEPTNGRYVFNLADAGAGVQISYSYVGIITPVYVSLFNVPPIVAMAPPLPTCSSIAVYRDTGTLFGQPIMLSAAGTYDADQDAIEYFWSDNDTTGFITLTPDGAWVSSNTAILSVSPQIGGAASTFNVGVAAVDLYPDLATQRHPPLNVSAYQILGTNPLTVQFTVSNTSVGNPPINTPVLPLAVGEEVMTWNIVALSPPSPVQSLNDQAWYVTASTLTTFTAVPLCSMNGSPPSPPVSPSVTTELLTAASYALLANSTITNTGSTVIDGDLGLYPGTSVTGFPPGTLSGGVENIANQAANQAEIDALAAYAYFAALTPTATGLSDLSLYNGGVFTPGVYAGSSSLDIPTSITLNGAGLYVFIAGSTTTLESGASILLENGATADMVVWVVGSSFTSIWNGISSDMVGTIIAQDSVTLGGGTLAGRALALTTAITIAAAEAITIPASTESISVTGYAIPQFQFQVVTIEVPYNAPPEIVFPEPEWISAGSPPSYILATTVARNARIEISPTAPLSPPSSTVFPVEYNGITDPDDIVTYAWSQVSGTPVTIVGASNLPTFTFNTNGVAIQGESLTFALTLCDGVNPCTTDQFTIPIAGYSYAQGQDTLQLSRSIFSGNISQRNQVGTWGNMDISILYNDLQTIRRNSVNDGTDRYIVISPYSVLVYGGIYLSSQNPMILLRKLFTPSQTLIVDAIHTEDDYTLVLDAAGNVFRYSTAAFIYTDNPDTTISLNSVSSFTFNRILCTPSFAGQRVLMFGGPNGVLLLQVSNSALQITGIMEISVESNQLSGADNVQFIRTAGVESLHSGQILIGTISSDGQTYETLIDLKMGQIIGTWNASKLKNQIVNTGEILFDPDSPYSGYPLPPANVAATASFTQSATLVTISWVQQRPDLVSSYNVQYGRDGATFSLLQTVGSGSIQSITVQLATGNTYYFRVQAFSLDGTSNFSGIASISI
jgi:hypothetical protein